MWNGSVIHVLKIFKFWRIMMIPTLTHCKSYRCVPVVNLIWLIWKTATLWKIKTINSIVGLDKWCKQGIRSTTSCFCVRPFLKHDNLGTSFPRIHYLFLLTECSCFSFILKESYNACFGYVAFFMVSKSCSLLYMRTYVSHLRRYNQT